MEKVTVIDSEKYQQYEQQIQQVIADIDYLRKHQQAAPKVIYTNKDMLELLGVNVKTLKKYRDNGFLCYSQIGDKFYYTPADIALFLTKTHKEAFAWK